MPEYNTEGNDKDAWFYRQGGFRSTFDGNGHTVSGITCRDSKRSIMGFFGATTSDATVTDLRVAGSIKGYWNLGGISAYNLGGVTVVPEDERPQAVLGCITSHGSINADTAAELLHISRDNASRLLSRMEASGQVALIRKGRKYVILNRM